MIIAIDGPAAAGKGTLARRIAAALGLPYLDTGLLYRAVGRRVLDAGGDPADAATAAAAASSLTDADLERADLRGPAAAEIALEMQQSGAVLDGRDIGTIIFPDADVKFFVTASLDARAVRRHAELAARNEHPSLEMVRADLAARDEADRTRAAAPLVAAADAQAFDTTEMDADTAFLRALEIIKARTPAA
jgi:cytidylate kinase